MERLSNLFKEIASQVAELGFEPKKSGFKVLPLNQQCTS